MSKRFAGIALLLTLCTAPATAEERTLAIGASGWEVFKPASRIATIFDLNYLSEDLLRDADPIGFRFKRFDDLTISIAIDPLSRPEELVGPVSDLNIGATTLSFAFHF
ncbi:MAG: hypothetical protein QNJ14_11865 [Woeseiaceae bacterium]|nr:hypothetical protein [Woeseiaceae bacterium]